MVLPNVSTIMGRRTNGDGSVFKRSDGRIVASALFEGKKIVKYGKTEREAWDKLQKALNDLKQGYRIATSKLTVKEYLENWLENAHRLELRPSSIQKYRGVLRNHINPAIGHLKLSSLTRQHVQSLYAEKTDAGLSPKTVKVIHALLNCALKDAVRDGLLVHNVCEYTTLPRMDVYEAHPFTQEECQRLIDVARTGHLWPLLLVAIVTGARRGELLALRWDDIDMATGVVRLHRTADRLAGLGWVENETKTVHGMRSVQLPQVAINALVEQRTYIEELSRSPFWRDRRLVFPGRFGNYLDGSKLLRRLKALLVQAGLPLARFHDLRHSTATLLLASGVNPKVVQELLGHSNISVTLGMYGHVLPNMQKDVRDKMEDMF